MELADAPSPVQARPTPFPVGAPARVLSMRRRRGGLGTRSEQRKGGREGDWEDESETDEEAEDEEATPERSMAVSSTRRRRAPRRDAGAVSHHHYYGGAPPGAAPREASWLDPAYASAWGTTLANGGVSACGLYVLFHIVTVFAADVRSKSKAHERAYQSEIARCAQQYALNHCGTPNQAPALSDMCAGWETCYARDPSSVASTYRIVAEVLADVVQGFLAPLGWKELAFVAMVGYLLVMLIARCTVAFYGQAKQMVQHPTQPPVAVAPGPYGYAAPPATPAAGTRYLHGAPDWRSSTPQQQSRPDR
jgi:hypothetical protein